MDHKRSESYGSIYNRRKQIDMTYINLYSQIDTQLDFENWQDELDITLINTKNSNNED